MSTNHSLVIAKAKRLLVGLFVFALFVLSCSSPEQLLVLVATPTSQAVISGLTPVAPASPPAASPTATITVSFGEHVFATATTAPLTPSVTWTSTRAAAPASRTRTPVPAAPTATAIPVAPGIYATLLKVDPPQPKGGQYMTFTVTFLNSTGLVRNIRWYVKIFRPDQRNSIGETSKINSTLNVGSSSFATLNDWHWGGMPSCEPYIARVYGVDELGAVYIMNRTDGSNLTHDFSICP